MTGDRIDVRPAEAGELPAVMNVLDAAMLEVEVASVETCIDRDAVLVAVDDGRVLGACVIDHRKEAAGTSNSARTDGTSNSTGPARGEETGAHVVAIAVRPGRRGQGVGSALVEFGVARWGELTAEFDARVRPFYESLGFDVEPIGGGRFRGDRRGDD